MELSESYIYKKEVDWSLLNEGIAIPNENQVIFGRIMDRFLQRGESKDIKLFLDGKAYAAKINNLKISDRHKRKNDILQIRYSPSSDIARALRIVFAASHQELIELRKARESDSRAMIRLPVEKREYLVIYTTIDDDTYLIEPILAEDINEIKILVSGKPERIAEAAFNYDQSDETANIFTAPRLSKIRKLNRKIGENLKLFYDFRCQICGQRIGEEYGSQTIESHHIDYFVRSLNNDASNQMIICPNHHAVVHDVNPLFDRKQCEYLYPNGKREGLKLNQHLWKV